MPGVDRFAISISRGPVRTAVRKPLWRGADVGLASAGQPRGLRSPIPNAGAGLGGYCAWCRRRAAIWAPQAEAWTVHEGRLFSTATLASGIAWLREIDAEPSRGRQANWPGILGLITKC